MERLFLVLAIVMTLAISQSEGWSGCPRPEDMLPCICSRPRGYTIVTCSGDKTKVSDGLKTMAKLHISSDQLVLTSPNLEIITSKFLGHANTHKLDLYTPMLTVINSDAFRTMEREFFYLRIFGSALKGIEEVLPALKEIFNVREITITKSPKIEAIPSHAFLGKLDTPSGLKIVILSHNNIKTIGEQAFSSLTGLEQLVLDNNAIASFHPTAIPSSSSRIKTLSLM